MKFYDLRGYVAEGTSVETILELLPVKAGNASFGVATFEAGTRHPEREMTAHDQHEISYIIEGRLKLFTEQGVTEVEPGQVVWLEANEKHASTAIEDGKVFWVLYG